MEMIRKDPRAGFEMDCGHGLQEGEKACQYSYYFASVIGTGKAQILEDPAEKLMALEIIMKHQTGKEFTEFRENPGLEKTVGSLSWKWKHTPVNDMFLKFCALIRESIVVQ